MGFWNIPWKNEREISKNSKNMWFCSSVEPGPLIVTVVQMSVIPANVEALSVFRSIDEYQTA